MAKHVLSTDCLLHFGPGIMMVECPRYWQNFAKSTEDGGPMFDSNGKQTGPQKLRKSLTENGGCFFGRNRQGTAVKLVTDSDFKKYATAGIVFEKHEDAVAFLLKWS